MKELTLKPNLGLVILVLILWLGGGPGPALGKEEKKFTRNQHKALYEAQTALSQKNDPRRAAAILKKFLDKHPSEEHSLIHYLLGLALHRLDNFQEAKAAYQKALDLDPDHAPSCLNLAAISYQLKDPARAARLWERAYPLSPEPDPTLLYQAGAAWYEAGKPKESARVLKRLHQESPDPAREWTELYIHVLMEIGKTRMARKTVTEFLKRNPEEEGYWRLLAQLLLNGKKYRGAAAALEVAYRLKEPRPRAWKQLASIYFHLNSPLAGARALRRSHGETVEPEEADELAAWLERAGRTEQALAEIDRAIKAAPTGERWLVKGRLLFDHGRYEEAFEALEKAVELGPKLYQAHLLLGFASLELGRSHRAEAAFKRAMGSKKLRPQAKAALEAIVK